MAVGEFNGDGIEGTALILVLLLCKNEFSRKQTLSNIQTHKQTKVYMYAYTV